MDLESVWGQLGIGLGSVGDRFGVGLGSMWVGLESVWDWFGIHLVRFGIGQPRFGIDMATIWAINMCVELRRDEISEEKKHP